MQKFIYCEMVGTEKGVAKNLLGVGNSKLTVELDFGNKQGDFINNNLVDENGKSMKFNSMVDAMNWMGSKGWEFCQAYTVGDAKDGYVYHWLLKLETSNLTDEQRQAIMSQLKTKSGSK